MGRRLPLTWEGSAPYHWLPNPYRMSPLARYRILSFPVRLLAVLALLLQALPTKAECGAAPCEGTGRLIGAFTGTGAPAEDGGCCGGAGNARPCASSCETRGCPASAGFLARSASRLGAASRQAPLSPAVTSVDPKPPATIGTARRDGPARALSPTEAPAFLRNRSLLC